MKVCTLKHKLQFQKLDPLTRSCLKTCLLHLHSTESPCLLIKTARFCSFPEQKQQFLPSYISKSLSTAATPQQLNKIHSLIITSGLYQSVFFSGRLISKYAQFRDPITSLSVFHRVPLSNNVFLWNSIIRALTQNGMCSAALNFYWEMQKAKLQPDKFTFPSVINACAGLLDFEMGNIVHEHVWERGLGSDLYIGNSLIDMYARFGCLDEARNVFEGMPQRDLVSSNSLISGYSANGEWEKALEIYHQSRMVGLIPDSFTVSSVLPICGSLVAIEEGHIIHGLVHKIGIEMDRLVNNGLLSMYCKCDSLMDAQRVFDEMVERDIVSWNTMICGYSQLGVFEEVIKLFQEMVFRFKPDLLTITAVLRACGQVGDLEWGRSVHEYMKRNEYECDTMVGNILITMYSKCGNLQASQDVFDGMTDRDSVSWNSLINSYIQKQCYDEAMKLFKMMTKLDVKFDSVTYIALLSMCTQLVDLILGKELHGSITKMGFGSILVVSNALVNMYAKCDRIDEALKKFDEMKTRDLVTWNTFIAGCVQAGDCSLGLKVVSEMRAGGLTPDIATMLGILPACSLLATKRQGKEIHGCILKFGFESDVPIGNALIEMYSKCGSIDNSLHVFNHMELKDVVTWTALVSAYGMFGQGKNALRAFAEMEAMGIVPDHIAFVAVIYACSHAGFVEEGLACFERMRKDYNMEPSIEHYACVVDLLSRSGLLAEAERFILSMPLNPDASIWGALLSACQVSGRIQIAERISERILELHSDTTGYYVLVSNVYAGLGKWDQVGKIREFMKARGLKKEPGCSWIEIRNRVYVFGTGDRFVEQSEEVYQFLEKLAGLMAKEGYVADPKFVLHDVEEDEKRDLLCGHSERLAIAFGLLNTSPGSTLQIMKNLRVCGDCHTVTKYISKIMQRKFIVRDANRFHIFKDGSCSCGDFW